jgi:CHAT domain
VEDVLDLWILDSGRKSRALACARSAFGLAVANLPCGTELTQLTKFRQSIDGALRGKQERPTPEQLAEYGHRLFRFAIREDLATLYNRLPQALVRIRLFSNRPDLQALPWEYLQEPERLPGPRADRSVVRIVRTGGGPPPAPLPLNRSPRVMLVAADPIDQPGVSWTDVMTTIQREFQVRLGDRFELKVVEGASEDDLRTALQQHPCDILHFSGHGDVADGEGRLVLIDHDTNESSYLTSSRLALLVRDRGIRLVVLSACDTATGDFEDEFAVTAATLVGEGITAVVANQLPIPNQTVAAFVGALYNELLASGDIDRATAEGRITLADQLDSAQRAPLEWGVPCLYRHIAGAQVFES